MDVNPNFDTQAYYQTNDAFASDAAGKSRGITALLAIFLGTLGVQYFYLGKTKAGVISLLVTLVGGTITCGVLASLMGIFVLVQGIMIFVMDNKTFDEKYVYTDKDIPLF